MKKYVRQWILVFALVILCVAVIGLSPEANAYEFYGSYTDVAKVYDSGSCPSIQGLAVGSQYLYTVKINGSDDKAFVTMINKDTGETTMLYNADAGSYYFDYFDHANDMDVWGIDGSSHLFVATTKKGASGIVRLKRSGSNLTKVAEYHLQCNGSDICATAMSIMSVSNGQINFLTKWGMDLYTGSVSTSATNATINMTKLCTITKSQAYIKDTYNDLSNYVNQGMGYHNGMLYLPISGDDANLNRSVILVYNLENASGLVYPIEHLSFRVTSGAYSALFELESCDICSADGKLYFGVQRRVTDSDTNHDGVAYFEGYTFSKVTSQTTHYTVQYNANGGSGSMADTRIPYGYSTPLRTNTFTRSGWNFLGWNAYRTSQDQWYYTNGTNTGWYKEGSQPAGYYLHTYTDGVTVAKTTAVDGDVVQMYAVWEPVDKTYTIRYDANGGTGTMADTTVVYGYSTKIRTNTFTRPGYTFIGWTAHRTSQNQWYYTDGSSSGWYAEGSQPSGWVLDIYSDGCSVAKTTAVDGDLVYFYAQWESIECQHSYTSAVTTAATCTTAGVRTYTCSSCSVSYTETIAATGHSYTASTTNPTCTAAGKTVYTCTNCGDSYTETIAATGHSYKSVVTAPTCTGAGYTTHTCANCGDSYTNNVTSAAGHSYSEKVTTAASCGKEGVKTFTCANCGDSYTETIPALSHSYSEKVTTAASCGKEGVKTFTCANCGDSYTETIPALSHNYVGGTCTNCGEAEPSDVVIPTMTLTGVSLAFEDEILYNLYFTADDLSSVVEMGLVTFNEKLSDGTIENAVDVIPGYEAVGSEYRVHTNGIPAKNMGDALYFRVYAKLTDGSYVYGDVSGYHAGLYAKSKINSTTSSDTLKALCVAMVNYGAEAQLYFGYNTDNLMNSFLTDSQKALVNAYDASMVDAVVSADSAKTVNFVNSGFDKLSSAVSFEGAFAINYYFTPANTVEGEMKLYWWDAATYNSVDVLTKDNASGVVTMTGTKEYAGAVEGIAAKELDQTVYACGVYTCDGVEYTTGVLAYSIGHYCKTKVADTSTMADLAAATAVYGYYAKQYFA